TWNTFSPRGGLAIKLTRDAKTSMRITAGQYYLPLYLTEFEVLSPGRAVSTTLQYDQIAKAYTTVSSVIDPRSQIRIDPHIKPPYTDQFAIGVEREVASNFAVGMNLIYKHSANSLGWKDIGGIYAPVQVTLQDGRPFTLFNLQNKTTDRIFLRTNGPGAGTN